MQLSLVGQVVQNEWLRLARRFQNVELDEFLVMPNQKIQVTDRARELLTAMKV